MTTPPSPSEPPVVTDNTASEPSHHGAQTAHRFATHWGFVLASVGSAVGMANVWGFPYKLGNNGGGAFLLIYIFFVVLFTYVGLPAEFANGRRARTGTLGTYRSAWATRGDRAAKVGSIGLVAVGRLAVHRDWLCRHCGLRLQGPVRFPDRDTDEN